ncbi:MAG: cobalamin B12-binding domain-containing protein [Deltaproteobacteria bacterium]|nr:cobalamin B12-binding domain-containing protein [Deltaproteobacteria bacterium]
MSRPVRVLVAKPGLDGHDRGAKVVARALRDAGFEVIYTGIHQTPESIVQTALDEDVDCVCLSVLSGAHNFLFRKINDLLKEKGVTDMPLVGGGIVPDEDKKKLKKECMLEIFTPGTSLKEIIQFFKKNIKPRSLSH